MKKILLLLLLIPILAYAETAVIGTQWKQIDSTVYPADDVTGIDISGLSNYTGFPGGNGSGGGIIKNFSYKNISSYFTTTAVFSPETDTRPVLSDGVEFVSQEMTGLTIGNLLYIHFSTAGQCTSAGQIISVFANISGIKVVSAKDETCENAGGYNEGITVNTTYPITATSHTVEIKTAITAGTLTLNGKLGRHFGGASNSPLILMEVEQ